MNLWIFKAEIPSKPNILLVNGQDGLEGRSRWWKRKIERKRRRNNVRDAKGSTGHKKGMEKGGKREGGRKKWRGGQRRWGKNKNRRSILIKGFNYDGTGPDAFFLGGTHGQPSESGEVHPRVFSQVSDLHLFGEQIL